MFSGIIAIVGFAGGLIMAKLALIQSASEPVVFYVHCFQFFRDIVVHHTHCSGVVGCLWPKNSSVNYDGIASLQLM